MSLIRNLLSKDILKNIRVSFRKVETELNEHLDSINGNTNEIQSVYEVLSEIEGKLDKLSAKIEDVQVQLDMKEQSNEAEIGRLTKREKEVFFALYMSESEQLTYGDLAELSGLDEVMVQEYITNLIAKGIPIQKKFIQNMIFISLDIAFKELQAKKRVIKK